MVQVHLGPHTNISGVEQLAARQAHNLEVVGSSPTPATLSLGSSVVEQRTENPCVVSSILTRGTQEGCVAQLVRARP